MFESKITNCMYKCFNEPPNRYLYCLTTNLNLEEIFENKIPFNIRMISISVMDMIVSLKCP